MAKSVAKPAETPAYEDGAVYLVTVKRAVPYGAIVLRPGQEIKLKGKVVVQLGDVVASAVRI